MINLAWIISGFYADENDFGGVAAIHNLAKQISANPGISLTVFALYYPLSKSEFDLHRAKVFTFNTYPYAELTWIRKLNAWRAMRKKFHEEITRNKFDLLHSFWAAEPGYVAAKLSHKYKIPLIANICGGELARFPEINYGLQLNYRQRHFIKKTFDAAKIIVSGSGFITDLAESYFDKTIKAKIRNIAFGVDEKLFDPALYKKADKAGSPVLINIAHSVPVKAHKDLLKALGIVKHTYPNIFLQSYGFDEHDYIKNTAKQMGLENNVKVNGFIDYKLIPRALCEADVFVLSSLYESQNMSMLEAAFMGLPVVSTDVGIAREITPYISMPGDHTALADNILKAIGSPKPAYKDLHERFSLTSATNKFIELYKRVLSS
ncbi:MAG: glycosyltransferase family 4 protein [Ignavibacteria bacterium]|nr:glycosyltransferase family 4 protein [Ignavibacteria bacterium]